LISLADFLKGGWIFLVYMAVSLSKGFSGFSWWMFFVRYPRPAVFAYFLSGRFCSFFWCMLVFSRCFRLIFLVDIFWQFFLRGGFGRFFGRYDMFAKFVGVFVVFYEWFWWIVKMDYFQLDGLYE
jgi:hypothetical protein